MRSVSEIRLPNLYCCSMISQKKLKLFFLACPDEFFALLLLGGEERDEVVEEL